MEVKKNTLPTPQQKVEIKKIELSLRFVFIDLYCIEN